MNRHFLPADWHDPEHPLYKLARPLSAGTASLRFQLDRGLQAAPDGGATAYRPTRAGSAEAPHKEMAAAEIQ